MKKSDIDINELKCLYDKHGNAHTIAKILHANHSRITKMLKENKIKTKNVGRKKEWSSSEIKQIIHEYQVHHFTIKDIAERHGSYESKIREIFRNNNITISRRCKNDTTDKLCSKLNYSSFSFNQIESSNGNDFYEDVISMLEKCGFTNYGIDANGVILLGDGIGIAYHTLDSLGSNGEKRYFCSSLRQQYVEQGYGLLQVFEDEYIHRKDIVLNKIAHIAHVDTDVIKVMGRKCSVAPIDDTSAKVFLERYHVQGFYPSTLYLGAVYEGNLVAVMCFKEERKNSSMWELTRFASDAKYICQGIGGKLFKWFVRTFKPLEVKSFADARWTIFLDNIYSKLGFELVRHNRPDYHYYNPISEEKIRIHKFSCRTHVLRKKYGFDESMTEIEMTKSLGYLRIWDCGLLKYVWKTPNLV